MSKPSTYLEDLDFDVEWAHVAVTSGLGAASLMNEPFILKSAVGSHELTQEEFDILEEIGEVPENYTIKSSGKPSPKRSDVNTKNKDEGDVMSEKALKEMQDKLDEALKQNAKLERDRDIAKAEKSLAKYGFGEGVLNSVSEFIVDSGDASPVIAAFDELTARTEAALKKSDPGGDNALKGLLDNEAGEGNDDSGDMTRKERIKVAQEKMNNKGGK